MGIILGGPGGPGRGPVVSGSSLWLQDERCNNEKSLMRFRALYMIFCLTRIQRLDLARN